MRIALISVLYGATDARALWARAVDRARAELRGEADVDVIAVDNGPQDGSGALPFGTRLIRSDRNVGFAAGCNRGLEAAAGADLIVLLNPDVELGQDFFVRLLELEWPDELAARGPAVLTPDGSVEQSARRFPTVRTGLIGRTSLLARLGSHSSHVRDELRADPAAGSREVDWVSGACLIAPADRFAAVGGLDEGYFLYWEDADWCRRARDRGLRVEYEPSLSVTHHQGGSSALQPLMPIVAFHRSALRYWRLHCSRSPLSTALAAAALAGRCGLKLAGAVVRLTLRPSAPQKKQ